jgi:TPR repeat protein
LAELYDSGVGTEKNLKQAIFWYAKAAQQGFIAAQYKLATIYYINNA